MHIIKYYNVNKRIQSIQQCCACKGCNGFCEARLLHINLAVRKYVHKKKKKYPIKLFTKNKKIPEGLFPREQSNNGRNLFPPLNRRRWMRRRVSENFVKVSIGTNKNAGNHQPNGPQWYHCYRFGLQNGSGELLCLQVFVRVCA